MKKSLVMMILGACLALIAGAAWANSLDVNATAAMGTSSSSNCGVAGAGCGLELVLEDPQFTPSTPAYLTVGPDKGFSNETRLRGSFFINPQNLAMQDLRGANHIQLFYLYEHFRDNSGVKIVGFLHLDDVTDNWFITIWHWDDNINTFTFTGNGFFALSNSAYFSENKIDFEWEAGDPGRLRMWRTLWTGGAPDPSGQILMFDVPVSGQSTAINYVFVGMLNPGNHFPGTVGSVYLDEFSFSRF